MVATRHLVDDVLWKASILACCRCRNAYRKIEMVSAEFQGCHSVLCVEMLMQAIF